MRTIAIRFIVSAVAALICAREAWRADVAVEAERALYARSGRQP